MKESGLLVTSENVEFDQTLSEGEFEEAEKEDEIPADGEEGPTEEEIK